MDRNVPSKSEPSVTPSEEELYWQLLAQFYEDSVRRYGNDSEQARVMLRLRSETHAQILAPDFGKWKPPT